MKKPLVVLLLVLGSLLTGTALGQSKPARRITLAFAPSVWKSDFADAVDFQNQFPMEPLCHGLTLIRSEKANTADYQLIIGTDAQQQHVWILGVTKGGKTGGMGYQKKMGDAVRDVCLTIWDDEHLPYPIHPGGTVE